MRMFSEYIKMRNEMKQSGMELGYGTPTNNSPTGLYFVPVSSHNNGEIKYHIVSHYQNKTGSYWLPENVDCGGKDKYQDYFYKYQDYVGCTPSSIFGIIIILFSLLFTTLILVF